MVCTSAVGGTLYLVCPVSAHFDLVACFYEYLCACMCVCDCHIHGCPRRPQGSADLDPLDLEFQAVDCEPPDVGTDVGTGS